MVAAWDGVNIALLNAGGIRTGLEKVRKGVEKFRKGMSKVRREVDKVMEGVG